MNLLRHTNEVNASGFSILSDIYAQEEIEKIISVIDAADISGDTFRKSANLFAIRQFLKEIPDVTPYIFNAKLSEIIKTVFGGDYFVVKSIYFDKPGASNWFVAYHQDLTISVTDKIETVGYGPWTVKQNQFAVQPPVWVLENIFTVRIHLDETNEYNGALKVIPGSHAKGIYRPETIDWGSEKEVSCDLPAGGVMLMKPLLLHSSARTVTENRRLVIHVEFSNITLPVEFKWGERQPYF